MVAPWSLQRRERCGIQLSALDPGFLAVPRAVGHVWAALAAVGSAASSELPAPELRPEDGDLGHRGPDERGAAMGHLRLEVAAIALGGDEPGFPGAGQLEV